MWISKVRRRTRGLSMPGDASLNAPPIFKTLAVLAEVYISQRDMQLSRHREGFRLVDRTWLIRPPRVGRRWVATPNVLITDVLDYTVPEFQLNPGRLSQGCSRLEAVKVRSADRWPPMSPGRNVV